MSRSAPLRAPLQAWAHPPPPFSPCSPPGIRKPFLPPQSTRSIRRPFLSGQSTRGIPKPFLPAWSTRSIRKPFLPTWSSQGIRDVLPPLASLIPILRTLPILLILVFGPRSAGAQEEPVTGARQESPAMALTAPEIASWCMREEETDLTVHGIVAGRVMASGHGVSAVRVVARWRDAASGEEKESATVSGVDGLIVFCDAPAEVPILLRAEEEGVEGEPIRVDVAAGSVRRVELNVTLVPETDEAALYGYVRDRETREPLDGVAVRLVGADRRTATNERGFFLFQDLPAGLDVLSLQRLGYGGREIAVDLVAGRSSRALVDLTTEPIELDPIEVTVTRSRRAKQMMEFERRREFGWGIHYDAVELERRPARLVGDLMKDLAGVRVKQDGPFGAFLIEMRGRVCQPSVWIDGRLQIRGGQLWLSQLAPSDLEAVELYKAGATPPEFFVPPYSGGCVTVVAWTKWGR